VSNRIPLDLEFILEDWVPHTIRQVTRPI